MKKWQCQCLEPIEISLQWAMVAGILKSQGHRNTKNLQCVKTPLKYHSRGLWWTEFWNHEVIAMLRIGNASVWTPMKYHSSYGYGHHIPLVWYFNGVQTLASLILHIAIALSVKNCKIVASKATGMIFQLGSSTGIANFAHCYCLISSKL